MLIEEMWKRMWCSIHFIVVLLFLYFFYSILLSLVAVKILSCALYMFDITLHVRDTYVWSLKLLTISGWSLSSFAKLFLVYVLFFLAVDRCFSLVHFVLFHNFIHSLRNRVSWFSNMVHFHLRPIIFY